jgi:predicted Zn-dependent protease
MIGSLRVLMLAGGFLAGCSLGPMILTVVDERIEELVNHEGYRILAVADPRADIYTYRFLLSAFPRPDILGLSIGRKRIYISYRLAQLAAQNSYHRWMLRQTLAHEIAHEVAGHANQRGALANSSAASTTITAHHLGLTGPVRFQNYSAEKELQADFYGMSYWAKLGWECAIWVGILREFQRQDYAGDVYHPTDRRLQQASVGCAAVRQSATHPPD